MEWKKVKLGDVLTIKYGKDHKKLADGLIPVYGSGGIMRYADTCIYDKPSILIPRKGSLNNIFYVDKPFWTVDTMFWSMIDTNVVDPYFLYCAICKYDFAGLNVGSAVPSLTVPIIEAVELSLPPLPIQRRIAAILSSLDAQIENNNRINRNLEAQAQALFKSWFVDFAPWGGVMPEDWREYELGEFMPIKTGKKDANVAGKIGTYPFFSCSQDILWTDNYSFDGSAILVAGNGDFNVKWYDGKFEAYQRTYVLMPYNPRYTHFLFYAIKHFLADITCGARGSVIKFITKGNLENFKIAAPIQLESCEMLDKFVSINAQIRNNTEANARLASLRDTLLPKLMKGEIEV